MAWLIICQVRGKETPPTSQEIIFEVTERTWADGVMRVLQHAISRLVHHHFDELLGTRYEHYGQIDHKGFPHQADTHTPFSRQLCHMEALLDHTQGQLGHVRMVTDKRGFELAVLHEDPQASIFSHHHLLVAKRKIVKRNKSLRQCVRDLEDQLDSLESHVSEIEDETAELHKENEAILSHDDDH
jgi:hypothetical protein